MALSQPFSAATLADLRKAVLAEAAGEGMPRERAVDVMLAVHELAANAVRYGGGAGLARVRAAAGELQCQVSDAGRGNADSQKRGRGAEKAKPWPLVPGHGLWLVHKVADRVSVACGLGGSQVTAVFALP
jgi:anti-sigma regulatory factor (Ser/Thr protein kinase)